MVLEPAVEFMICRERNCEAVRSIATRAAAPLAMSNNKWPPPPVFCGPGRGGPSCNVSRETILRSHDPFAGFVCGRRGRMSAAKYIPGWSVGYPTYFEMSARANACSHESRTICSRSFAISLTSFGVAFVQSVRISRSFVSVSRYWSCGHSSSNERGWAL